MLVGMLIKAYLVYKPLGEKALLILRA